MAASFDSLSPELVTHIISYVSPRASLCSVALVSRTLNQIATPKLYATVDFAKTRARIGFRLRCFLPFAILMLHKPSLAACVHSLSTCYRWYGLRRSSRKYNAHIERPDHTDLEKILQSAVDSVVDSKEKADEWFKWARENSIDGLILSILLPKLKNLRRLDYHKDCFGDHEILSMLSKNWRREAPSDAKQSFGVLTDVHITGSKIRASPDVFGSILKLPAIKRLYGYSLGVGSQDRITEEICALGEGSSAVELIELRECEIFSEDLTCLLKACKSLKTFTYEFGTVWEFYHFDITGGFVSILASILTQKHCLENLSLIHPESGDISDLNSFTPISLASFEKLVYLQISALCLGGTEDKEECSLVGKLPSTLKTLHVTCCGELYYCAQTLPALQQVLEQKELYLPQFRTLILEGRFMPDSDQLDRAMALIRLGKSLNIDIRMVNVQTRPEKSWFPDEFLEWQEL